MLKLKRPLIIFDIESTGLDKRNDRIVSLFMLKVEPDGSIKEFDYMFNPTISIPEEASKIHGITDEMVKDSPLFADKAQEIASLFHDADIAGYNLKNFDIPLLAEEMLRVNPNFDFGDSKVIDSEKIFKKHERRTLSAAVEFYCGKSLENAHSADADVLATYEVLLKQIEFYDDLSGDVSVLADASVMDSDKQTVDYDNKLYKGKDGVVRFNFGKYKDQPVTEHLDYVDWMFSRDFTRHTKKCLSEVCMSFHNNQENQTQETGGGDLPF